MKKYLWNRQRGRMRVVGMASGSGKTLWETLSLQRRLDATFEGSPFEVVGVFSDDPTSTAAARAIELGLSSFSLDLREFCRAKGCSLRDRAARDEFDARVMELIEPLHPDLVLLAGYVWAVGPTITESVLTVGVHPADLWVEREGKRAYAGADGVGATLAGGETEIRASSYIATSVIDGGPVLIVSPPVAIDLSNGLSGLEQKKHYLKLVNEQARLVGAKTVLDIASGRFAYGDDGTLTYGGVKSPRGIRLELWAEHAELKTDLKQVLGAPRGIAVLGASNRPGLGNAVLDNIRKYSFQGNLYAVNLSGEAVGLVPGFKSVEDIPGDVDLAVLALPTSAVLTAAESCGRKGVRILVVLTAGFRETGEEGGRAELELRAIIDRYHMRLFGPNCSGLVNTTPAVHLDASMLPSLPREGGAGLITQSGAISAALTDFAETLGLGFSMIFATGNQADLNACDLLPILAEDPSTKVVMAYLETIPDPPRFARILARTTAIKPVVILKSGRTSAGASAASSHTGSLAGGDAATEALLCQAGAIRVDSLEEAFLLTAALEKMPRPSGRRVGVISNAGGPGILLTDALASAGFQLPVLSDQCRKSLAARLLPQAYTGNPLDLVATASPGQYAESALALAESGLYDAFLVLVVPPAGVDTGKVASALVGTLKKTNMPVYSCFLGPGIGAGGKTVMLESGIPCFEYPEQMVSVLNRLAPPPKNSAAVLNRGIAAPAFPLLSLCDKARLNQAIASNRASTGYLPPELCVRLLEAYGFAVARSALVTAPTSIIPPGLRPPLVAKIDHPEILHKSDVGGVITGIADGSALAKVSADLFAAFRERAAFSCKNSRNRASSFFLVSRETQPSAIRSP